MSTEELGKAAADAATQKNVLKRFKQQIVLPAFAKLDAQALADASDSALPGLYLRYYQLPSRHGDFTHKLLLANVGWRRTRIWWACEVVRDVAGGHVCRQPLSAYLAFVQ